METGFNGDKEKIAKTVENNGRNTSPMGAYTNIDSGNSINNSSINRNGSTKVEDHQMNTSTKNQFSSSINQNANMNEAKYNEEYSKEVAPKIIDFNRSGKENTADQSNFQTEYAAEVVPNTVDFTKEDKREKHVSVKTEDVDEATSGRGMAGLALALSILSLFVLPVVLGAAGIIIGFIARRRGATTLGAWAIGIGAISIIVGMFILPFFS